MAVTRTAHTTWTGGLTDGSGTVFFDSSGIGAYEVSWPARSEQPGGKTSPEELIAAALSSCYSMALSHQLTQNGAPPRNIDTQAKVTLEPGAGITAIHLSVRASLAPAPGSEQGSGQGSEQGEPQHWRTPNIAGETSPLGGEDAEAEFQKLAAKVKDGCPVGQALSGVKITLDAALED